MLHEKNIIDSVYLHMKEHVSLFNEDLMWGSSIAVVFCVAVLLNATLIYASPQKGVDECRRSISQSSAQHSSSMFFSGSPWIFTKTMPIASHSQVSFSPLVFQCRELSVGRFFRAVPGRPPGVPRRWKSAPSSPSKTTFKGFFSWSRPQVGTDRWWVECRLSEFSYTGET